MAKYVDKQTGKVFEMAEKAFARFMASKKFNGQPRYALYEGVKKKVKPIIPEPVKTIQQQAAEAVNDQLKGLTARQLVDQIETLTDLEQLQALQHDGRKTVAAAAVSRLAALAEEDAKTGGDE